MKAALLLAALLTALTTAMAAVAAPPEPNDLAIFGQVMGGLQRGWREDCSAGGGDEKITVVFSLDMAGRLTGEPQASSDDKGPAVEAAMARAVVAVKAAAPYRTLPAQFLGKTYHVVFDGHVACPTGK